MKEKVALGITRQMGKPIRQARNEVSARPQIQDQDIDGDGIVDLEVSESQ